MAGVNKASNGRQIGGENEEGGKSWRAQRIAS